MTHRLKVGLGIVAGLLFVGCAIGTNTPLPPLAPVYLVPSSHSFFAAPCLAEWKAREASSSGDIRLGTYSEARRLKFTADRACVNTGAHSPEGRSLAGYLLEAFGILPPLRQWWDTP